MRVIITFSSISALLSHSGHVILPCLHFTYLSWNPQHRCVTPQEVIELMIGDIDIIRNGLRRIDDDLVLHRSALRDLLRALEDIPGARREH